MTTEQMPGRKTDWASMGIGFGVFLAGFIVVGLAGLLIFRIGWVNSVENYQLAYMYSWRSGKITQLDRTGYFVTTPIIESVHHVDLRPMQVCINANQRVLNCKLVQFDPAGLETFLSWHGRDNYDGPGSGSGSGTTTLSEILKSYAYEGSGKTYPFLRILRELKNEEKQEPR